MRPAPIPSSPWLQIQPGKPHPLGATWDGKGVNFALFSENAEKVELCLFDSTGRHETARIALPEYSDTVWHGYVPDLEPGRLYGYRVYGPYDPQRGHRFNHHKLLIDPYAKVLRGPLRWKTANFGYNVHSPRKDLTFDSRNNARYIPKSVVVGSPRDRKGEPPLEVPWRDTVIYEMHVKGMTALHPGIPRALRGTFAGLATDPVIGHLEKLGVTTVELIPIHPVVDEPHLIKHRLRNYWGYNPYCYFAVDNRYLSKGDCNEFAGAVKRFHDAGIEVLLDVVFNHTGEGNHMGPTLSFRGIDNATYYRLHPDDPRHYLNESGCGNTLNLSHPRVLRMVMDALRYWVEVMGVDGFRFDLATTLARGDSSFNPNAPFFAAIQADPVLSQVKLIAEPWDLGEGGYRLGEFPPGWAEWNDRFRNTARSFWKGDFDKMGEMAARMAGSSDIFQHRGRRPHASVNFITAHDGFTLEDLVTYNEKHNEANQEENRDGTDHNLSWNCGEEGPSEDQEIRTLRLQQKRNLMATLLLSQGVPMITAGDEMGRTQDGNNNAYCQDNEINWMRWDLERMEDREFLTFVRMLIRLRRDHPIFRRTRFFRRENIEGEVKDITWLSPDGHEMSQEDWNLPFGKCFGYLLTGDREDSISGTEAGGTGAGADGQTNVGDQVIVMINAHHERIEFHLPPTSLGQVWEVIIDTARLDTGDDGGKFQSERTYPLEGRSLALLMWDPQGS